MVTISSHGTLDEDYRELPSVPQRADQNIMYPGKSVDVVAKLSAVGALASAFVLSGCSTGAEALQIKKLQEEVTVLDHDLSSCQDKSIETNGKPVIVSFGTFGLKTMKPGKENRFTVNQNFSDVVEQTMVIWPPVFADVDITLSGDTDRLVKIPIGSTWGVVYRSPVDKPKETVVIDVGAERYVMFVVRK